MRNNKSLLTSLPYLFLAVLFSPSSAIAQNPCEEVGSDCRVMSAGEVKAMTERVLAVKALLPVPDPARYAHDGAAEASTTPFVAEAAVARPAPVCRSWQAGCFTTLNTLLFGYFNKADRAKPGAKPGDILAAAQGMQTAFENRVELNVWLRPHAHMVDNDNGKCVDVTDQDAVNVAKNATFLSWESGEEVVNFHMVLGPRTCKEEETLNVDKPAKAYAPARSMELLISGPKAEVAALKKKLNRAAFEALLGPVVK